MISIHTAAGLDIHKHFLIGTILNVDGRKEQARFSRDLDGIDSLKAWIQAHNCDVVACESTNSFWYHIHDALEPVTRVIVGNAHDMKVLSHKKTDRIDSEIIATLAMKDMIAPSRIFTREQRDFRNMVRLRHFLVRKRTDVKNRIHSVFDAELFHLSRILSDVFGKTGKRIMDGLVAGQTPDEILAHLPAGTREKKGEQLREILLQTISPCAIFQLKHLTRELKTLDQDITSITDVALSRATQLYPDIFPILRSVPGVGEIAAVTLLAEIGDFQDFPSGNSLASWMGIVPRVYQSADHLARCSITKRGSKLARWIITQVAHAASRRKNSRFYEYYMDKKAKMGSGKAIIALARKMITIIWHIVTNKETYVDEMSKPKAPMKRVVSIPLNYSLEEVILTFVQAASVLKEKEEGGSDQPRSQRGFFM